MNINERLLRFRATLWSAILDTPYTTLVILLTGAVLAMLGAWLIS